MLRLSRKISRHLHSDDVLIDISNVTDEQIASVERAGLKPVLVSTQKTFNYRVSRDRMPRVKDGTVWFVLRVPGVYETGNVQTTKFDGNKFRYHRSKKGSPHIKYHKNSKCSISDARRRSLTLAPSHRACEIDDLIITNVSIDYGIGAVSNDRRLIDNIYDGVSPRLGDGMHELMSATEITQLVKKKGLWTEIM